MLAANRRIHAWILPHGKDRRVADTFFLILLSSSDSLSLCWRFRRTNAWFEVLSPDCVAAVNFRKLSCQEEIHGRKGLNKHQVKPSCAELSKRESKKTLDISSEKICRRKNEMEQQLCSHSFIFSQTLTQKFAFLTRILPHVCQLCVVWRPIYIAARSTDRASERARAFYPTPVVLYLRKKSERVSFSPPLPFPKCIHVSFFFPPSLSRIYRTFARWKIYLLCLGMGNWPARAHYPLQVFE